MKALTISQPYASLIASGEKWIENRSWTTLYRGKLAIHAGKGSQYLTRQELNDAVNGYVTGAVIAIANLLEVVRYSHCEDVLIPSTTIGNSKKTYHDVVLHEHAHGPVCFLLQDVRQIEPVPAKGRQGLWNWQEQSIKFID